MLSITPASPDWTPRSCPPRRRHVIVYECNQLALSDSIIYEKENVIHKLHLEPLSAHNNGFKRPVGCTAYTRLWQIRNDSIQYNTCKIRTKLLLYAIYTLQRSHRHHHHPNFDRSPTLVAQVGDSSEWLLVCLKISEEKRKAKSTRARACAAQVVPMQTISRTSWHARLTYIFVYSTQKQHTHFNVYLPLHNITHQRTHVQI